ncbi:MAG: hypothetical protein BRC27_02980 [Nanohaloarchaea archaeon SW_10_44_10]|nr:MAG: hypothetical protein BRC27_02980 [Nanohaloarchaea archaeon SW_10_44_10]
MDLDEDYIEYVGQSSLALLAISAAYFVDLDNLITLIGFLPIAVLYGYTAYISREGFKTASMLSFVTLIFIPISALMGFIAVFIAVSNTLISLFSKGKGFRSYSSSTLMPMIFTGLILGLIIFGGAQTQPDIKQNVVETISEVSEKQTSIVMDHTNLADIQQEAGTEIVRKTSENTIVMTRSHVLSETNFNQEKNSELNQAFTGAQEEIPEKLANQTAENAESINMEEKAGEATRNLVEANLGLIILMLTLALYTINPLISILTGLTGFLFQKLAEHL